MPEVETAADQPQTETAPEYPDNSLPSDSTAEPTSEPQSGQEPEEGEPVEGAEPEAEPTEPGETETSSQDEFLSSLTPEELAYYAKRYPTLYKAYQEPNQPADLKQAFVDRVNQDHAYAELRDGSKTDEPTAEETETAQPVDQTEARKQYYAQIDDIVTKQIDQNAVNEMGIGLLEAMGVDTKSTDPEVKAIIQNAPKVGKVLARGAVDLLATTLPGLLGSRLEMVMPGITRMYYRSMYGEVWDGLRSQTKTGPDGQAQKPYEKLPDYGTPQFQAAIDKAVAEFPGLEEMEFKDKRGNPLPAREQAERKYQLLAKMMTGQQVNPKAVAEAVDTGKKQARAAQIQRAAGKALGAGRSTQQLSTQADDEDPVMADLDRAIAAANESLSPLSRPKAKR